MNVLIPKSTPMVVFSLTIGLDLICSPVSHSIETKYFPVGVLLIVACLISPLGSLCMTISIPFLNLGIISLQFLRITLCGILKLPALDFFLNWLTKESKTEQARVAMAEVLEKFSDLLVVLKISRPDPGMEE